MIRSLLIFLYSLWMMPLGRLLSSIGQFIPAIREQVTHRYPTGALVEELRRRRAQVETCVLFYVSSAGEYEQARPLIGLLKERHPRVLPVILFFSQSGFRFAESQGESEVFLKAPWDDLYQWRRLLGALRPNATIVVRYELWPAFLHVAQFYGPLFLVNGSASQSLAKGGVSRLVARWMLGCFQRIFVVSQADADFYSQHLQLADERLVVAGDSKFDRARERVKERASQHDQLQLQLDKSWGRKQRFVVGSAWQEDLRLTLSAYQSLQERELWQLIIAPHDISPSMISWMKECCEAVGLNLCLYSQIDRLDASYHVMIIDSVGILPEVYGCADMAMVGGALHHRVHNVLEPAVRGLYLCFGPRYHTSSEAKLLVDANLVQVVETAEDLRSAWNLWHRHQESGRDRPMAKVDEMCGATARMIPQIEKDLAW